MFESAEVGHKIDRAEYDRELPRLREALLNAQFELAAARRFPVVIIIGGVDGAGKGETVNALNEWMDPRHILTSAFGPPTDEERERPRMWRYWRALPPKGRIGILFGSWYTDPIVERVMGRTDGGDLDRSLVEIQHFERMLCDEGALVLKFWFHLSKDRQRKRLRRLEKSAETRWRVTKEDWRRFKIYDRFREVSEHALRETSTAHAPWVVVEGEDERYRNLTVGRVLLDAIERRLAADGREARIEAAPMLPLVNNVRLLRSLDLGQRLAREAYVEQLEKLQGRLNQLSRNKRFRDRSLVAVFEGADAAGKGSAIRRVTAALDARQYQVIPIAAPTDEERAQPYLWRFWRQLPRAGRITIFDRSWYGRVLVERVEKLCAEADWMRAYAEINDFEEQLLRNGTLVLKFWLHISEEEQLRRFRLREKTPFKRFKITPEDWRNRKKWNAYEEAVADMVDRTSTEIAPWTLVEAEDKLFARIKILRTLVTTLEEAL